MGKSTKDILPICNIDLKRYLGTWYEIARLPNSFEKGLENITATYNLRSDGKIEVINAGIKNGQKKIAKGIAWIPDKNCTGKLLVSFFWIFKSQYNIILLNEVDYSYSVVTSSTNNYLWILSRKPKISNELYDDLVKFVSSKGFDIAKIIKVTQ
ncbi:MAG TPA: lipocalin family protein [Candidatus Humimicrobiaceae bacterium]